MKLLGKLFGNSDKQQPEPGLSERGILIFHHTSEVIKAESLLKKAALDVKVKGPPPDIQSGCDMVIEFPLLNQLQVIEILNRNNINPIQTISVQDHLLEPVSLYNIKELGFFLMIRAANMKITVKRPELTIVNISGGGCPDVPYLADQMVGKNLYQAPAPKSLGLTLCGYSLQLAYEEAKRLCPG